MLIDTAFSDKGNGVRVAMAGGISDTTLMATATAYRNAVLRKYVILPAGRVAQTLSGVETVFGSIKYDGEGVFVYFDAEADICVAFNAPSGKTRVGLRCTEVAKGLLKAKGHRRALLCAELYLRTDRGRSRVSDVIHTTSNGSDAERDRLTLAFHNAVMLDGRNLQSNESNYEHTWNLLGDLFSTDESSPCHRAVGQALPASAVPSWFEEVTGRGLEGIVVHMVDSETTYKIKPNLSVDAVVIGFVEGPFEDKYGVLSLLCATTAPGGRTLQVLCRVGSGLTDQQREALLEPLSAVKIEAPLKMADSDGRPITFVRPGMVVEVEGEELRAESLDRTQVVNQTFVWDGEALHFSGVAASPKLTHATFGAFRGDKVWNDGGTRMSQVMSDAAITRILVPARPSDATPTIAAREVYHKNGSVRKIIAIHRDHPDFARYAIVYTDYSLGRQKPLTRETRVAESEERLGELVEHYRGKAKKKGWELV